MDRKSIKRSIMKEWTVLYITAGIFFLSVCIQGGYFPACIVFIGLAECILYAAVKPRIKLGILCPMLIFSLWYVFCTVKAGIVLEYASKALLPTVAAMFYTIVISIDKRLKEKLLICVIKFSIGLAVASIIFCTASSISSGALERALFPFQYSNACGIYFAVLIILSKECNDKLIIRGKIVFYITLILAQSVGAIILAVAAELIYSRNKKKLIIIIAGITIFALCLYPRIYQSAGTFIERLLQIRDGLSCIAKNPVFGIGGGRWQELKNIYQSGFYEAVLIHSSIIQIGVDAGVAGILLFFWMICALIRKSLPLSKKHCICMGIFLVHSCMDISMSFLGLNLLMILILTQTTGDGKDRIYIGRVYVAVALIALAAFGSSEYGLLQTKAIDKYFNNREYSKVIQKYEADSLLQSSVNARLSYLKALYNTHQYEKAAETIDRFDYKTTDMLILRAWCSSGSYLTEVLSKQKYNRQIYREIEEGDDTDLKYQANTILDEAINSMSDLGKILYNRMEN